jgi:hypothetical protein
MNWTWWVSGRGGKLQDFAEGSVSNYKNAVPTKKSSQIECTVNSHSIFSKLCFPKVPVPPGRLNFDD